MPSSLFLLTNPDNVAKIEITNSSLCTSEALFIHAVSDWIKQINNALPLAKVASQPDQAHSQMRAF